MNTQALARFALKQHMLKQFFEQRRVVRKVSGHRNHALDYTESGHKSRRQNLMGTVIPEVKTVEQPVEFLDGQDNRLVGGIGRFFESLRFQSFEPKAYAVALPIQDFHSVARLVEENEKCRVEHGNLDIQLDQSSHAVDGFSKLRRFGVR